MVHCKWLCSHGFITSLGVLALTADVTFHMARICRNCVNYNIITAIISTNPLPWFKAVVVTFFVKWVYKGVPFSKEKATKTGFGGRECPIQMLASPTHPVLDELAALLLTCLKELHGH